MPLLGLEMVSLPTSLGRIAEEDAALWLNMASGFTLQGLGF